MRISGMAYKLLEFRISEVQEKFPEEKLHSPIW